MAKLLVLSSYHWFLVTGCTYVRTWPMNFMHYKCSGGICLRTLILVANGYCRQWLLSPMVVVANGCCRQWLHFLPMVFVAHDLCLVSMTMAFVISNGTFATNAFTFVHRQTNVLSLLQLILFYPFQMSTPGLPEIIFNAKVTDISLHQASLDERMLYIHETVLCVTVGRRRPCPSIISDAFSDQVLCSSHLSLSPSLSLSLSLSLSSR
jgi:hypothetical protein